MNGIVEGPDHILVSDLHRGDVFTHGPAANRKTLQVQQRLKPFHYRRNPARPIQVPQGIRAAGAHIADMWGGSTQLIEYI